jgi:hypothetical protein
MPVFAVLAPLDNQKIGPAIESLFGTGENFFRVSNGQWFVATPGTAQTVADRLGISDGTNGGGVVVTIASYWGRANADLWPWLSARMDK